MALPPIPAIPRIAVTRPVMGSPSERQTPDPAQTLRLVVGLGGAGELLARSDQGQIYSLSAAGPQPSWRDGQTLLVQVLRAGPPLEVRVLGMVTADGTSGPLPPDSSPLDTPALRVDQAGILRLAAAANDSMAQAAHWRQLTLAMLREASIVDPLHATLIPANAPASTSTNDPALLLRQLSWHGWPLTLWLERRRWGGGPNRRARRRPGTRLCLTLVLPLWGRVGLVLDVTEVQVGLTLIVTDADAVPALQAQAGAISARMARSGLRLMRCQVLHQPHYKPPTTQAALVTLAEHELPLALFRAGAEVLEGLRRAHD